MKFCYLFFCLMIARLLSASPFIWAPDAFSGDNKVLVIDAATNTVFQTIPQSTGSFNSPFSVAFTSDGLLAYVFNGGNNTVSVINTASYQLETPPIELQPFPSSTTAGNIVISPNGEFAYITNSDNHVVSVINISTNSFDQNIGGFSQPAGIVFSPDGAFVYVTDFSTDQLFRIDTSTNIATPLSISGSGSFQRPIDIALTANGTIAYVVNALGSTISVVDLVTNTFLTTISLPSGYVLQRLIFSPDETLAYVTGLLSGNSKVFIINTQTNTMIGSIPQSQGIPTPISLAIALNNGNILYVGNGSGSIVALNTNTRTLIATVPNSFGTYFSLAVQPSGRARQFARPSNRRP